MKKDMLTNKIEVIKIEQHPIRMFMICTNTIKDNDIHDCENEVVYRIQANERLMKKYVNKYHLSKWDFTEFVCQEHYKNGYEKVLKNIKTQIIDKKYIKERGKNNDEKY